jgi:hypothetical protein
MLDQLQQRLTDIYRVDPGHDIRDFLITDRAVAAALGQGALLRNTDETVLLSEDDDGLALSVYLDRDMLDRLDSSDPLNRLHADQLDDLCKVVEGISHFNYIVWCASRDRSVTLLELELQAEIDKFVSTLLILLEQGDTHMSSRLHELLFDSMRFKAELDDEQRARYEAASDYAGRFCHRIRERLMGGYRDVLPELRHFYRLTQTDKISHIHSRVWAPA